MNFKLVDINKPTVVIEEYVESLRRAKALADNPQIVYDLFGDKEQKWNVSYDIKCFADEYFDEFFIFRTNSNGSIGQEAHIEILNSEQAKSNEIEEIKGKCVIGVTEEDIPNYKLGETVQTYKQIGNTDYWYREL